MRQIEFLKLETIHRYMDDHRSFVASLKIRKWH